MAFKSSDLSVLAYANNFTLWHYTTIDTDTVAETSGYLNNAADMLRVNDLIIANLDTDGTPETKIYVVSSNDGSAVGITVFTTA